MTEKTKTMQDIKRAYFDVSEIEKSQVAAQEAIDLVTKENGVIKFNFDPEKDLPEGYGLAIIPTTKTTDNERKTIGVCVAAIPSMELLQAQAESADFVRLTVADALVAKVANAVRPRADGSTASVIPFSVEDFTTSNRPEGIMAGFNETAPTFVSALKQKGLTLMTKELLRQILTSKAFAEQQFPKVPQDVWERVLDGMIAAASKAGLTVVALHDWKATRNTAGMPMPEDVDLSDLDFSSLAK